MKPEIQQLFDELLAIEDIEARMKLIFEDVKSDNPKFKKLAETNPKQFFKILGGKLSDVEPTHEWAIEFTYKEYIEENFEASKEEDSKKWNLIEESKKRADETGNWYVTALYILSGAGDIQLPFEFDFCEGLIDDVIGHPYITPISGKKHGIPLDN
jgi:hypothetical protein